MVIAVLGATGQLGSELLELWGEAAVGLTREELDLSDPSTIEATLETIAPEVVVNAAAYNQVDKAESEPAAAMLVNAQGPRQLARWCASRGVRLVHVSTDFVFGSDTSRSEPYAESDETGPLGAYALSKLGGELYVRSGCPDHLVVRTCGLYGHAALRRAGGGNFVETMLAIADGDVRPIRVVDDQHCTPTSAAELARLIAALVETDRYGVYHATCTGGTTWCEFARTLFRLAGRHAEVEPITTAEYGARAARPASSVLDCRKLAATTGREPLDWEAALEEYLAERDE